MKHQKCLLLTVAIACTGLIGCAGLSSGQYYTIDVYSDYEGMEQDLETLHVYDVSKANKIGVCYALKGQKALTDGLLSLKGADDKPINYKKSSRTAPHGYEYKFKGFQGFYEDKTAIDLSAITSDCALFTTFDLKPLTYNVTVHDSAGDDYKGFSETLEFGTVVKDNADLLDALTDFPDYVEPNYYQSYAKSHWDVYLYDDDGNLVTLPGKDYHDSKDKPVSDRIAYDDLETIRNYAIGYRTVFEPRYEEPTKKSFTVSLTYKRRTLVSYAGDGQPVYEYSDFPADVVNTLPTSVSVVYGQAVPVKPADPLDEDYIKIPDYAFACTGTGVPERYDFDDPNLPNSLIEVDIYGEHRAAVIDYTNILYHCSLTLVYDEAIYYNVNFHSNLADPDEVPASHAYSVKKGESLTPPSAITGEDLFPTLKFTGEWTLTQGTTTALESFENIQTNYDLWPVMVSKTITGDNGLSYEVSLDDHGYLLSALPEGFTALTPADFNVVFPENYPFVGVKSFGGAEATLASIVLSNETKVLAFGAFAGFHSLVSVDLQHTQITELRTQAFHNLYALNEVSLPATLQHVGADLFKNARTFLETGVLRIDLTEAEVAERDFASNWNSGVTVIYKA